MRATFAWSWLFAALAAVAATPSLGAQEHPLDSLASSAVRAWLDTTDLGKMINRDASRLKIIKAADGAEALVIGDTFRSVLVVNTSQTGEALPTCVSTAEEALAVLEADQKRPDVRR